MGCGAWTPAWARADSKGRGGGPRADQHEPRQNLLASMARQQPPAQGTQDQTCTLTKRRIASENAFHTGIVVPTIFA
jgi:hypothetical protein